MTVAQPSLVIDPTQLDHGKAMWWAGNLFHDGKRFRPLPSALGLALQSKVVTSPVASSAMPLMRHGAILAFINWSGRYAKPAQHG